MPFMPPGFPPPAPGIPPNGEDPLAAIPRMQLQNLPLPSHIGSQGALDFLNNRAAPSELPEIAVPDFAQELIKNPPRSEALTPIQEVYKQFLKNPVNQLPVSMRAMSGFMPEAARGVADVVNTDRAIGDRADNTYRQQLLAATELGKGAMFGNSMRNKALAERDSSQYGSDAAAITGLRGAEAREFGDTQDAIAANNRSAVAEQGSIRDAMLRQALQKGQQGHSMELAKMEDARLKRAEQAKLLQTMLPGFQDNIKNQVERKLAALRSRQYTMRPEEYGAALRQVEQEGDDAMATFMNKVSEAGGGPALTIPKIAAGMSEGTESQFNIRPVLEALQSKWDESQEGFFGSTRLENFLDSLPVGFEDDPRVQGAIANFVAQNALEGEIKSIKKYDSGDDRKSGFSTTPTGTRRRNALLRRLNNPPLSGPNAKR